MFLAVDKTSKPLRFSDLETVVPKHFTISEYNRNEWHGQMGLNKQHNHWIYILKHFSNADTNPADVLQAEKLKYLDLGPNLAFGFVYKGKSYRRYVYLIKHHRHLYWLESGSSISTLLEVKEIADRAFAELRVRDQKPVADPAGIFRRTTSFVTPVHTQSLNQLMIFLGAVMFLIFLLVQIIFHLSCLEPRQYEGYPSTVYRGITIKINYLPLGSKMIDGIVALVSREIYLYSFRKKICRFDCRSFRDPNQIKAGKTLFFKQDYIRFRFLEAVPISMTGKKTAQPAKAVTLYLGKDQIRHLLTETGLPHSEPVD